MKKILTLFFMICLLISCKENQKKIEETKKYIVTSLPRYIEDIKGDYPIKYEGDNFYFIYGLDYSRSFATNIKYRGILYSDKLKEYGYTGGIEIGLTDLDITAPVLYVIANKYCSTMIKVEIEGTAEKKAKEIFGNKVTLSNDGSTTEYMHKTIMGKRGKKLPFEDKVGYYATIVDYFVDDLDKIDNDDIKKKTFELAKFIYDDMNYVTSLQIYVRDNSFFENYNLVYQSISPPFIEREDIKTILNKIENKEKISEDEKIKLCEVFYKGGLDFDISPYRKCFIDLSEIKSNEELTLDKIDVTITIDNSRGEYN